MPTVKGCHLIGSVPLPNTEAALRQCNAGMPNRLKRIPDGETGARNWFTFFQSRVFEPAPEMSTVFRMNSKIDKIDYSEAEVDEGVQKLKDAGPVKTGYDDVAIESYQTFKSLKEQGVLDRRVRFQASIPTTPNVLSPFVQAAFQAKVEPIYEEGLFGAIRRLQNEIPLGELAIQIDLAIDTAFWEGVEMYKPWFGDGNMEKVKEYIVNYIVRMIGQVDEHVEVGLHNCYGDMEHRHWLEPSSLAVIVERSLRVYEQSPRKIDFFHCPVPKSAIENLDNYLAPLAELIPKFREHGTELYLGLVHENNAGMTKKMIDAAGNVLGDFPFGVATECGWGRTEAKEIEDIMRISTEVSEPVL